MRLGRLQRLEDVFQTIKDWKREIPQEYTLRYVLKGPYYTTCSAACGDLVQVDGTARNVAVYLEPATAENAGRSIRVRVIAGTHDAYGYVSGGGKINGTTAAFPVAVGEFWSHGAAKGWWT